VPGVDVAYTHGGQTYLEADTLLTLARDRSAEGRAALLGKITDLFSGTTDYLSESERTLMDEVLQRLIGDVEQTVKMELAERLATLPDAPRGLILALANDEFLVAHPILMKSKLLRDPELIEIIHHRTLQHMLSISMRGQVSEDVSDELISNGDNSVVRTLLENKGAHISQKTYQYLVEQSQRIACYREPLIKRDDLSRDLAVRMYSRVSAALRKYILTHFEIDPNLLDENLGKSVEALMAEIRSKSHDGGWDRVELSELLAHANALSPRFLIELLREGEISVFEAILAEMAGLRLTLIRRFVYEPGGEALAIACKAVRISKADFASIFLLSRQARPGDKTVDPQELPTALDMFDRIREETARKVVQRWRLDPNYLYAMKQLDEDSSG